MKCPYCESDVRPQDEYNLDHYYQDCEICGKEFEITVEYERVYFTNKI